MSKLSLSILRLTNRGLGSGVPASHRFRLARTIYREARAAKLPEDQEINYLMHAHLIKISSIPEIAVDGARFYLDLPVSLHAMVRGYPQFTESGVDWAFSGMTGLAILMRAQNVAKPFDGFDVVAVNGASNAPLPGPRFMGRPVYVYRGRSRRLNSVTAMDIKAVTAEGVKFAVLRPEALLYERIGLVNNRGWSHADAQWILTHIHLDRGYFDEISRREGFAPLSLSALLRCKHSAEGLKDYIKHARNGNGKPLSPTA